jgi:integrase
VSASQGIRRLHSRRCPAWADRRARCRCNAGFEASVYDKRSGDKIRRTFPTAAAARTWRADAHSAVHRGLLRASEPTTVGEAADSAFTGMAAGTTRTRSGDPYKPSALRSYRQSFDVHVRADLGAMRLTDVERRHVQALADRMLGESHSPSTIRNAVMPLRVIFRRALRDGLIGINPCTALELPANRSAGVQIVSDDDAAALIAALDSERDRALWATAFYAGLRAGELMALRWGDVDLTASELHVERSYDPKARQFIEPKSRAGRRRVPIAGVLRGHLRELAIGSRRADTDALVFGDTPDKPFAYDAMLARVRANWKTSELAPIGLHAARHTAASVMIAAGVNVKALSTFMGHASITITLDRYGHLLPGSIQEATGLLDAFLERPRDGSSVTFSVHSPAEE